MYDVKMFNDPWEQEPTGWTQVVDTGPSPRSRHSMIYDENRKKIVLFGGHSEGPVIDTWQLEDNVWKEKQDIGPSYPVYSEMVYSSNGIVLFGGTTFRPGALGANVGYI